MMMQCQTLSVRLYDWCLDKKMPSVGSMKAIFLSPAVNIKYQSKVWDELLHKSLQSSGTEDYFFLKLSSLQKAPSTNNVCINCLK